MTCREVYEFLDDYVDAALASAVRDDFTSHLTRCESCRRYLATYVKTRDVAIAAERAADAPGSSGGTPPEELVQAVLEARRALREREKRSEGL
jgi:anti-sigma factor RsiW